MWHHDNNDVTPWCRAQQQQCRAPGRAPCDKRKVLSKVGFNPCKTKSIINKATTGPREPTDSKAPTIEKNQTCLSTRRTSSQDTQAQGSFRKCFTLAEDK